MNNADRGKETSTFENKTKFLSLKKKIIIFAIQLLLSIF